MRYVGTIDAHTVCIHDDIWRNSRGMKTTDPFFNLLRMYNKFSIKEYDWALNKVDGSALIYVESIEVSNFVRYIACRFFKKENVYTDISIILESDHFFAQSLSLIFICEQHYTRIDPMWFHDLLSLNPRCKIVLISIFNFPPVVMEPYISHFISLSTPPHRLLRVLGQLIYA